MVGTLSGEAMSIGSLFAVSQRPLVPRRAASDSRSLKAVDNERLDSNPVVRTCSSL